MTFEPVAVVHAESLWNLLMSLIQMSWAVSEQITASFLCGRKAAFQASC